MGTILAVGTDEQIDKLADYQSEGVLGCFSLTEKLAGVQSGLVVETTATWDNDKQVFILNTPHEGARKNWISQGFVAGILKLLYIFLFCLYTFLFVLKIRR